MQYDKWEGKYKLVKQMSRAHRRPAYKSKVFINKETEAAAEPPRIGKEREEE